MSMRHRLNVTRSSAVPTCKPKRIMLFLTVAQYRFLQARARSGYSMSGWVRHVIQQEMDRLAQEPREGELTDNSEVLARLEARVQALHAERAALQDGLVLGGAVKESGNGCG